MEGQASPLKLAHIFNVFSTQICFMVALQFDQAAYVCEEYNSF